MNKFMSKKKIISLVGFGAALTPMLAFAANTIGGMLVTILALVSAVLPVLISLAVVVFVWGVISYVIGADEEAKKKGRDKIIYGLIGLVVIFAMWGLIAIIAQTFQIGVGSGSQGLSAPCVPGTNGNC